MNLRKLRLPVLALTEGQWGEIALLIAMGLWGTTYVAAQIALRDLGPMMAAFTRFALASVVTWPILLLTHGVQPLVRRFVPALIGSALFQTTLYFALQYTGMRYTTTANTALIVNTRPLVIALLSVFFLREHLARKNWLGLVVAFVGVVVLVGAPNAVLAPDHVWGDFLIGLNALSGALGIICAKRALEYYQPFTALVYQITLGALGLLPLALIETGGQFPMPSVTAWTAIAYMAILCTAIPQALLNVGLTKMRVAQAAPFYYIVPILNIIVAYFVLGESITWALAVGGGLILLGNFLASRQACEAGANLERAVSG